MCTIGLVSTLKDRLREVIDEVANPTTGKPWGSANALAAAINPKSAAHIRMILNGKIKRPTEETIDQIAATAGVSPLWLSRGLGPRHAVAAPPPSPPSEWGAQQSHEYWRDLRVRAEKRARQEKRDISERAWDQFEKRAPTYGVSAMGLLEAIQIAQAYSDAGVGKYATAQDDTGPQRSLAATGSEPPPRTR